MQRCRSALQPLRRTAVIHTAKEQTHLNMQMYTQDRVAVLQR